MGSNKKMLEVLGTFGLLCMMLIGGDLGTMSIVHAKDYGISNPVCTEGDVTWDTIYFGNYFQSSEDNKKGNKKEPIRWRVLSVNGNDAFIMSEDCLDCKPYNVECEYVTWETCTLRGWLNEEFYKIAFTVSERNAIMNTLVDNMIHYEDDDGGNYTLDKIYLLSISEAKNKNYGFGASGKKYNLTRISYPTSYASSNGVIDYWWRASAWLRSPAFSNEAAAYVDFEGNINVSIVNGDVLGNVGNSGRFSNMVNSIGMGVRPALHIDLSNTDVWCNGGKVTSEDNGYVRDVAGQKVVLPENYIASVDDIYYRITKSGKKKGEVEFLGWCGMTSYAEEVTIPNTVKINGYKYKVTSIAENAFTNYKSLKKVTIGSNVKKIGKKAFYKRKHLKTIIIKSKKLKVIGKNAIKGISKEATITVPKRQYKKYKKIFKSKIGYKKTMKIRKR